MNTTFWACAVFLFVERVKCTFNIVHWRPPADLILCPSKAIKRDYYINSALIKVTEVICDIDKISEMDISLTDRCSQAYLKLEEPQTGVKIRLNVACLPHEPLRRGADRIRFEGSVDGASSGAHLRRKRQEKLRRKRRRHGRYWHSVGAKIPALQV